MALNTTFLGGGGMPDSYCPTDYVLYNSSQLATIQSAPQQVPDYYVLPNLPPVYQQYDMNSCVANAALGALRYVHNKHSPENYTDFEPSRMFLWYNARVNPDPADFLLVPPPQPDTDAIKKNENTKIRTAIHSLRTQGVCKEELWPYEPYGIPTADNVTMIFDGLDVKPNPSEPVDWALARSQAATMIPQDIRYYRIVDPKGLDPSGNLTDADWNMYGNQPPIPLLEKTLADGFPFIFGIQFYDGYSAKQANETINAEGVFTMPPDPKDPTLKTQFRHVMIAVGFDSVKRRFLVQNSWGEQWPTKTDNKLMQGRFWMPYEWMYSIVGDEPMTWDFWVIKCCGQT